MNSLGNDRKVIGQVKLEDEPQKDAKFIPDYIHTDLEELNMKEEMSKWSEEAQPQKEKDVENHPKSHHPIKFVPDFVFDDLRVTQMQEEMQSWSADPRKHKQNK